MKTDGTQSKWAFFCLIENTYYWLQGCVISSKSSFCVMIESKSPVSTFPFLSSKSHFHFYFLSSDVMLFLRSYFLLTQLIFNGLFACHENPFIERQTCEFHGYCGLEVLFSYFLLCCCHLFNSVMFSCQKFQEVSMAYFKLLSNGGSGALLTYVSMHYAHQ